MAFTDGGVHSQLYGIFATWMFRLIAGKIDPCDVLCVVLLGVTGSIQIINLFSRISISVCKDLRQVAVTGAPKKYETVT